MTLSRRKKIILGLLLLIVLSLVYFIWSPLEARWFPQCPMKLLSGYSCPGCGAQRAVHAALHGNFGEALRYNYFLSIGLPYLIAAMIVSLTKGPIAKFANRTLLSQPMLIAYVVLYLVWWVVRNILGI